MLIFLFNLTILSMSLGPHKSGSKNNDDKNEIMHCVILIFKLKFQILAIDNTVAITKNASLSMILSPLLKFSSLLLR